VSRSLRAWTKGCALISTAIRGAGRIAKHECETQFGYEPLRRASSSLTPIRVATAVMLWLAFSPAVALGKAGSPNRAPVALTTKDASHNHNVTRSTSHNSDPPRARRATGAGTSRPELIAFGSGYAQSHGSSAVKALQRRLISLGYSLGPVDGRYGPQTVGAVIRFQAEKGLNTDGIAGPLTLAALASARPVLRPGDGYSPGGSPAVRTLQRNLAAAGYPPGPIDGRYGPLTKHAVMSFQAARHLQVDGIAGPHTLGHLQATLRLRGHQGPHRVHSRPRTPHRGRSRRVVPPSTAAPAGSATTSPRATRAPRPSGAIPIAWIVVVACLLIVVLAAVFLRGHRRVVGTRPADEAVPDIRPDGPVGGHGVNRREVVPDGASDRVENRERPADEAEDEPAGSAAFRLGLLLAQDGDLVGAEDAFRRADDCGHPAAPFELGILLVEREDLAAAKEAFRRADDRGHPEAAFNLGVLLAWEGDHASAKEAFRRADRRGHNEAPFDLGAMLLEEGDQPGAEDAFRRADERGDARGACNLGVLLEQRGDRAGAKEAYRRADVRGHAVGSYNLGAVLAEEGDRAGAKDAFRRADERGDPAGAYSLGLILEAEGDRAGAKEAYLRADQRGDPAAACNLGLLLKQEGDRAGALEAFQRAGEHGSSEIADVAHAELLELIQGEGGER
jgi:peptidoglycan hydrolase-like protein with peptidoglycan-binding domain/TPR repeat protein